MNIAVVILAAGKGDRMESAIPKVMHPLGQAPLLIHALRAGQALNPARTIVVTGHDAENVAHTARQFHHSVECIRQAEQLGTGHAVAQARNTLSNFDGDVVVLYADTPLICPESLQRMIEARAQHDVVVLGFHSHEPSKYGRLVMAGHSLERIVEYKDANTHEKSITYCNSGLLVCEKDRLFELIEDVENTNAANEYYLTDIIAQARSRGLRCTAVTCAEDEVLGINNREELGKAERLFQSQKRSNAAQKGALLIAPDTVFFSFDTEIEHDAVIEPYVVFGPGVTVQSGATIRSFSHVEGAEIRPGCTVGPYARIRSHTTLNDNVRIGNFVELKNAEIARDAKINHLSYIGDANIGEAANIGAGTITCNYDGVMKHHTIIGKEAFIGSNTMLVAPVEVGDNAMTASNTVVTRNVEPDALAIGRSKLTVHKNGARKLRNRLIAKHHKHPTQSNECAE